jgi:hypothetical protein
MSGQRRARRLGFPDGGGGAAATAETECPASGTRARRAPGTIDVRTATAARGVTMSS